MKKFFIIICSFLFICVALIGLFMTSKETNTEYLRIHIRANSNSDIDQNIKYKVKSAVVDYLTPYLTQVKSKEQAEKLLNSLDSSIEEIADNVLVENGFTYKSNAEVRNEEFPLRVYDNLTLESGYYDALIIELGSGKGDNWWCVVYPPLCFTTANVKYEYKSKIVEIIQDFYKKKESK